VNRVELSTGVIEYSDSGGPGPVVVLVPGLAMNGSVWREVVADLVQRRVSLAGVAVDHWVQVVGSAR